MESGKEDEELGTVSSPSTIPSTEVNAKTLLDGHFQQFFIAVDIPTATAKNVARKRGKDEVQGEKEKMEDAKKEEKEEKEEKIQDSRRRRRKSRREKRRRRKRSIRS